MRIYLDCYPCFLRQALEAVRLAGGDESIQATVISQVLGLLGTMPSGQTPPYIGAQVHRLVRRLTDCSDPYRHAKAKSTRQALSVWPHLRGLVRKASDPFDAALRLSIAGNIIDHGVGLRYDLQGTIDRSLSQPIAVDEGSALRSALRDAEGILFLADNAGETVFDRLLIEVLDRPVLYAVKGGPVLNDATEEDARAAGVDSVATIISTGSDAPGTLIQECSLAFRDVFNRASVVLAKGQANYETLSDAGEHVFLLLQAKCPVIARDVGAPVGSMIVKRAASMRV